MDAGLMGPAAQFPSSRALLSSLSLCSLLLSGNTATTTNTRVNDDAVNTHLDERTFCLIVAYLLTVVKQKGQQQLQFLNTHRLYLLKFHCLTLLSGSAVSPFSSFGQFPLLSHSLAQSLIVQSV